MAKKPDILDQAPLEWANRILSVCTALESMQYCRDQAEIRRKHGLDLLEMFWKDIERALVVRINSGEL